MNEIESVVVRVSETGEYTVFLASTVAADMEDTRLWGKSPGYAVVAFGLNNEEAWGVAALLNALRDGGYVLVTKSTVTADVKRDAAWWTLNACIAIAMQAGMMELAEAIEEMRELL